MLPEENEPVRNIYQCYNKTEQMIHGSPDMYKFTHLIVEAKSKFSPNLKPYINTHEIMDYIEVFHHVSFNYFTIPPVKIKTKPVLFLLKRKDNYLESIPYEFSIIQSEQEDIEDTDFETYTSLEGEKDDPKYKLTLKKLKEELHESYEESEDDEGSISKEIISSSAETLPKVNNLIFEQQELVEGNEDEKEEKQRNKTMEKIKTTIIPDDIDDEPNNFDNKYNQKIKSATENIKSSVYYELSNVDRTNSHKEENLEEQITKHFKFKALKIPHRKEENLNKLEDINIKRPVFQKRDFSQRKEDKPKDKIKSSIELDELYKSGQHIHMNKFQKQDEKTHDLKKKDITTIKDMPKKKDNLREKGKIKDNIRNIIKQFEADTNDTLTYEVKGTKDKIKRIIEDEKRILEEQELSKLQEQILTIIESNPNIIDKESIKNKLENIIFKDIQRNSIEIQQDTSSKLKKPITAKKTFSAIAEDDSTDSLKTKEPLNIPENTPNIKENEIIIDEKNKDTEDGKNAVDLYEDQQSTDVSEDTDINFTYDENIDAYYPLEMEFQAANEHLENIMLMIEEIVSNMEVEEESYSEEDDV